MAPSPTNEVPVSHACWRHISQTVGGGDADSAANSVIVRRWRSRPSTDFPNTSSFRCAAPRISSRKRSSREAGYGSRCATQRVSDSAVTRNVASSLSSEI